MRHARALLRCVLLLHALAACGGERAGEAPAAGLDSRPDLVLVSIDTLRADRLSTYGYERGTSPALDRLATRGARFERIIAESSWTLPSHATLFTGLAPGRHGVDLPSRRLAAATPRLTDVLRRAGYRTIGLTAGGYVDDTHGFDAGFDVFEDDFTSLEQTLERARELLAQGDGRPRFLFVHTFDVHCPYELPQSFPAEFVSRDAEFIETRGRCGQSYYNSVELSPGEVRHISDCYDIGILEADRTLGLFLDQLDPRTTLVAITSDHGEELGEYGRIGHEKTLSIESLRVPLVLAGPGVPSGVSVAAAGGLADVAPTLLELLGLETLAGGDGASLVPWLRGEGTSERAPRRSVLEWKRDLESLSTESHHLVHDLDSGAVQVFELDPQGGARAIEPEPELKARLLAALEALRPDDATGSHAEDAPEPDARERARLRALGYAQDGD